MHRFSIVLLGFSLAALCSTGCGKRSDRPETLPASAVVTLNGTPVEGATVVFHAESPTGKGATGRTDAQGLAKMMTFEAGDGAIPGQYKVTIEKMVGPDTSNPDYEKSGTPEAVEAGMAKSALPAKYSAAHTSGFTANVTKGGENKFTFALEGK